MSKTTTRRRFTAAFKTKVCLEALKERESIEALAKKFNIHPNQINIILPKIQTEGLVNILY